MTAGPAGKHSAGRAWWARWWVIAISALVAAGVVAAGSYALANRGPSPGEVRARVAAEERAAAAAREAMVKAIQTQLVGGLAFSPSAGATGVSLNSPVSVKAAVGSLSAVKVASASGVTVPGRVDPSTGAWTSSAPLAPSTIYTVTAVVSNGSGVTAQQTSTFTSLTPVEVLTATVFPTNGMTVGVGQPIAVRFSHAVESAAARQAVESHFTVAMSQPVPGGWYWFSPVEMHFRPQSYWPAHDQVAITGDLDGWDAGGGRWGSGQLSDSFAVGDARISYANLETEVMRVTVNGATIATYPISGGRPKYPTMAGDHIVLDRESVVHMVSSTVGIPVNSPDGYDEYVYQDVHISDSGEYVHAAPWSVGSQGVTNVSHGCINLSTANATAFYGFSRVGDIVEVSGSPRPPESGDHGVMDWSTPWTQWSPARVVSLGGAPASTTTSSTTPSSTTSTSRSATSTSAP